MTIKKHPITSKDRTLAHIALATVKGTTSSCPEASDLALLIDGRVDKARQEALWNHLASCPSCYTAWRISCDQQGAPVKKRTLAKIMAFSGGLLAAAASIMLFVNIQYSSEPEVVFMDNAQSPEVITEMESSQAEITAPTPQKSTAKRMLRALAPLLQAPPQELSGVTEEMDDPFSALDNQEARGAILLDINRVIPTVLQKVKQVGHGDVIEVKTYKRDRGFSLTKQNDDTFLIREFGFRPREFWVSSAKLKRALKHIIKTEFPQSNKAWLRVVVPEGQE